MSAPLDLAAWEARFAAYIAAHVGAGDAAHDDGHVRRVVTNARTLAGAEGANLAVVLPAAWLHDCVTVPKDSPKRSQASRIAAEAAGEFLHAAGYPAVHIPAITHAIAAHSFTARIPPETLEAQIVQDADRLDALGAIGIARTIALGGAMGRPLYDLAEPFPVTRLPDDAVSTLDHFYTKLLGLAATMQTAAARAEAERRTVYMRGFLATLGAEIAGE